MRKLSTIALAFALLALSASSAWAGPVLEVGLEKDPLANEAQQVTVRATGGQYRLNFGTGGPGVSETADIAFDATPAEVQGALNAIANISADGGSVTVSGGPGDALGTTPYLVAFSGGPLGASDVQEITVSSGTVPLSGGSELVVIRTTTDGGISRSDLRHDFTVKVKNTAPTVVEVGASLACNGIEIGNTNNPKLWNPNNFAPTEYDFEWRRNGILIPDETGQTYEITVADEGASLQCMVKGTNADASTKYASFPAVQVPPAPSPLPPIQASITGNASRPSLAGTGTALRTCNNPTNWVEDHDSDPETPPVAFSGAWEHQWLRNGDEIAGATASTYTPSIDASGTGTWVAVSKQVSVVSTTTGAFSVGQRINGAGIPTGATITAIAGGTLTISKETTAAGTNSALLAGPDAGVALQCMVIGTTGSGEAPGGGGLIATSPNSSVVGVVPSPPAMAATILGTPDLLVNALSGPQVTLELPGPGAELIKASGWSCSTAPAPGGASTIASCQSLDVVGAGAEGSVTLAVQLDHSGELGVYPIKATVSGDGLGAPFSVEDTLEIGPAKLFGITAFETQVPDAEGDEETQAGAHPIAAKAEFAFSRSRGLADYTDPELGFITHQAPVENIKRLYTHTPRGFVGNALSVPELCPTVAAVLVGECPESSIVGGVTIKFLGVGLSKAPIYSIKPEYGTPAQFAFPARSVNGVYTFYPELRADDGYAITLVTAPAPMNPALMDAEATLCGFGAKTFLQAGETAFDSCRLAGEPGANPTPLITLPTRCAGEPPVTEAEVNSWQNPDQFISREFTQQPVTGCEKVDFQPTAEIKPTSQQADSPTGLDVELTMPTNGLEGKDGAGNLDPDALAQANMKMTRVTFPEGMAINPSAGQGLGSCSEARVDYGTNGPISCPDSSKIGTIEIDTPILQETLTGAMYIGKQSEAPEGALIGLHLVFESKKDGIIVKIPGEVKTNPVTGQLVTVFDEILEDPFSRVKISFNQGPRSSLLNPPKCGTYAVKTEMVPWTIKDLDNPDPSEIVTQNTSFEVSQGPGGGPCPSGNLEAKLNAGTTNPLAGQSTSFEMGIARGDGTQRINGLEMTLPPGILGVLKGVPYCPEAAIQEAIGRDDVEEGQIEIDSPACPESSRIGSVTAGAGGGPNPIYVDTGKAYLAGPYKGAPLSLVVIAPAVAGPLDLGTVVVRNQLRIDRRTTAISAVSDPIPTILHGVLLDIRDVRLTIDRPGFILNPTNCEEMGFNGEVSGESGARAPISDRFQLGGCENLGFKPKLSIKLIGGTKRGDHPALVATLRARPGDANIARAAVTLPPSAFLDQAHIRTICTRVQFAAETCPKGAIYGSTWATTPLLEETLRGNVILRSSDNKLPDLVGTLNGIATVDVVGRIDSVRGGLRSTFDLIPDAPVKTFRLRMQGGNKGLVINSKDLCKTKNRATVKFTAQNGRRFNYRPLVRATKCKKAKKRKGAKNRRGANSR